MSQSRLACVYVAAGCVFVASAAAAPRTYVASYGNDANTVNNCGPTTPCRTFATAMTVADTGGQVIVLDSAGYGSVVITKSISLIAPDGVYAGLTVASGGTAVQIATAGVDVVLKGLTITGQAGGYGIAMTAGNSLHVEKTTIADFAGMGIGLSVQAAARVSVVGSVIRDSGDGIAAGGGASVSIATSQILNHSNAGIMIRSSGTTSGPLTTITVGDSLVAGANYCIDNYEISGRTGILHATHVTASNCAYDAFFNEPASTGTMTLASCIATKSGSGFRNVTGTLTISNSSASGNARGFSSAGGTLVVSGSTATNNATGFERIGGTFVSMGNNTVYGNTTDTSGTITSAALQ
jgi:hypothetical protein